MMRVLVMLVLVLVLVMETATTLRPYVTCTGCETFLQCFFTCPLSDYPGINRQDNNF